MKFLILWLVCAAAFADVASEVDPLFSAYDKPNVPGASVVVVQGGRTVYAKGYGLAELASSTKATEATNYRLASLSKQFTGMAILILVDRGLLNLEDTLTDIFPDFPAYGKKITVNHLAHHTSGLRDYEGLLPGGGGQVSDADILEIYKKQSSTSFTPGSQYRYSNGGYCMLAQIVEKKSGMKFAQFVRKNIFLRAGMFESQVYETSGSEISNRAYGYTASGNGFQKTDQSQTSATQGDGGVYTSAHELYLWDQVLYTDRLVSAPLLALAFTPGPQTQYGFGWELDSYQGLKRQSHTGSTIGFRTAIQRFPEKQFMVAVLINRANSTPWEIARQIVDRLLF